MSRAGAAGEIYSTVEDLQRWNAAVFGGKALKPESLKAAFTKAKTKEDNNSSGYGYGWMTGEQRGLKIVHHSGGLQGFVSYLTRFPEQELTIAVLHNALPGTGDLNPGGLAAVIAEPYLWKEMKQRPSLEVDESVDPKTNCRFPIISGGFEDDLQELRSLTNVPHVEDFSAILPQLLAQVQGTP